MEELFSEVVQVTVRTRDSEERRENLRITIIHHMTTSHVHKGDLLVRLTDDDNPYFLFNLSISEEDFQSLKVQQGLLVDFASFPQKFIDLLNLCLAEQASDNPRFLLLLSSQSPVLDGPTSFSVVETNAFRHLNHLSLCLTQGRDKDIKDYLAVCLSSLKAEKQTLESQMKKTQEDLSRQLTYAQQTITEKTRELDKLRSEWTSQLNSLTSRHSEELQSERGKAAELQTRLQEEREQQRLDLERRHQYSSQQLQARLTELEASCKELTERRYRNESVIRDLKIKLSSTEESLRQQVASLRKENGSLDSERHEKELLVGQLQKRVAYLEQEVTEKDQQAARVKEALQATQQQKETFQERAESAEQQVRDLEDQVKVLSEDIKKANSIIKKFMGDVKTLSEKNKMKNVVILRQQDLLKEHEEKLSTAQKDLQTTQQQLQTTQQQLQTKEEEVAKLKEQLTTSMEKLSQSKELLKTNEDMINWLHRQLNQQQLSKVQQAPEASPGLPFPPSAALMARYNPAKPTLPPLEAALTLTPVEQRLVRPVDKESADDVGLDPKYFERRPDSIPLYGLSSTLPHRDFPQQMKPAKPSAYFSS